MEVELVDQWRTERRRAGPGGDSSKRLHLARAGDLIEAAGERAVRDKYHQRLVFVMDRLGELLARIANLTADADDLKAKLAKRGDGAYEGELFRATVKSGKRKKLNMEAVYAKLSPQFIAANTTSTPCTTVKVVARNNEAIRKAA